MKKLLFGLLFGLVLLGTAQVTQAMTMENYFTTLKNMGLTDESHRTVFLQTIWNNWSKSMQFTTAEIATPPFALENIMAFGPISLYGSDPNIAMMGNWQKLYIAGHGVNGNYIIGTNFNFLDEDQSNDPTRARLYQDGVFKPFFKMLKDAGAVNGSATTVALRNLYTAALVTYPSPTNIGASTGTTTNSGNSSSISTSKTVTLTTSVTGGGKVTGGKSKYKVGTVVSLTAKPSKNWAFTNWEKDCVNSTGTVCTLTMDANKVVSVVFTKIVPVSTTSTIPVSTGTAGKTCYINKTVFGGGENWKKVSCTGTEYKNWPANLKRAVSETSSNPAPASSSSASNQSASATTAVTNATARSSSPNPIANVWNAITGFFK